MQSLAVVEAFDVSDDRDPCSIPRGESLAMNQFVLQRREEALGTGVVVAVAVPTHAGQEAVCCHQSTIVARAVEHPAVRVMDEARWRLPVGDGHAQGGGNERLIIAVGHRPADDLARTQVDQDSEIQPALTSAYEGHIAHPTLVGAFGLEATTNPIRCCVFVASRVVRHLEAAPASCLDAVLAPYPCDTVTTASDTFGNQPGLSKPSLRRRLHARWRGRVAREPPEPSRRAAACSVHGGTNRSNRYD